jgi:Predicted transcriptional regulators
MRNLAVNLITLRKNRAISQEELASHLNVTRQTISKWEREESDPSIPMLITIADYYGITLDDLVIREMQPQNYTFSYANNIRKEIDSMVVANRTIVSVGKEIEEDERIFYPRISADKMKGYKIFQKAYELDLEQDRTNNNENISAAMKLYIEAYDNGATEAAVNIIRILIKVSHAIKFERKNEELPFQDRINYYLDVLEEINSDEGKFYRAENLIYALVNNGETDEKNKEDGWDMMMLLAEEGNEYAINFVKRFIKLEESDGYR